MCAACVAQGIGYVGTALASLQVMGARAKAKRGRPDDDVDVDVDETELAGADEVADEPSSVPTDEPVGA